MISPGHYQRVLRWKTNCIPPSLMRSAQIFEFRRYFIRCSINHPPDLHRSYFHPLPHPRLIFSREYLRGAPLDLPSKLPPYPNPGWSPSTGRHQSASSGRSRGCTGGRRSLLPPSLLESRCTQNHRSPFSHRSASGKPAPLHPCILSCLLPPRPLFSVALPSFCLATFVVPCLVRYRVWFGLFVCAFCAG